MGKGSSVRESVGCEAYQRGSKSRASQSSAEAVVPPPAVSLSPVGAEAGPHAPISAPAASVVNCAVVTSAARSGVWEPGEYLPARSKLHLPSQFPSGAGVKSGPREANARSDSTEGAGYGVEKLGALVYCGGGGRMLGQGRNTGVAGVCRRPLVLETKAGEWGAISEGPKVPPDRWVDGRAPGSWPAPDPCSSRPRCTQKPLLRLREPFPFDLRLQGALDPVVVERTCLGEENRFSCYLTISVSAGGISVS